MLMKTAMRVERGSHELQDRAEIIALADGLVLAVADGAGGRSGGAGAAEKVVKMVREFAAASVTFEAEALCELLKHVDQSIEADPSAGETTAVVTFVSPDGITGVSVGDSGAWLIGAHGCENLTKLQQRKPFLGTGMAIPVAFRASKLSGTLLLASDGLLKYTSQENICKAVTQNNLNTVAKALIDLVRYPSGSLPDDVCVVICR
jgi:serine/threonine protein phosphatase PrpC